MTLCHRKFTKIWVKMTRCQIGIVINHRLSMVAAKIINMFLDQLLNPVMPDVIQRQSPMY
jgi:hypothetical protein